ncbi:MAG: LysR family transcriptional regulator [Planctomycetota bacterium]
MVRTRHGARAKQPGAGHDTHAEAWEARIRVWIVINEHGSLGPGKFKLLEAIDVTHSLAAAARRLRMSYRLAWQHLRLIEQRTGIKMVDRQRGGSHGGGTELTPAGKELLETYNTFCAHMRDHVQNEFRSRFAVWIAQSNQ